MKNFLYRILCGFFLGVAIFAPGFSGSIVAIIMGVYQDLLRIISNPFKQLKKNIAFCIPLGIGVVASAVLFVIVLKYLFDNNEKATYMLFVGLIAGNLPTIWTETKKCGYKTRYLIAGACAFIAAFALAFFAVSGGQAANTGSSVSGLPTMAIGGFAGGIATLIPGMSVSMVLLIIGVYNQIIQIAESLLHLDMTYILHFCVFGVCAVVGLVATSRGIKTVFERFPGIANSLVFGFLGGSLIGVLVNSLTMEDPGFSWWVGGLMLAVGLGVSILLLVAGRKLKTEEK